MENKFFDVHFHAYNLSHPHLSAFLDRVLSKEKDKKLNKNFFDRIKSFFSFIDGGVSRGLNLLSIMDNDLGDYFLYLDYYLSKEYKHPFSQMNHEGKYKKIVLSPLVVDFGVDLQKRDKRAEKNVFYKLPPQKPVVLQLMDLFRGIKFYYENNIKVKELKGYNFDVSHENIYDSNITLEESRKEKLLEIYPFMGINTQHYTLEKLEKLLNKYFKNYDVKKLSGKNLYDKFYEKLGQFDGNVFSEKGIFDWLFVGIKVYPPLGFDPWPEKQKKEMEKVEHLYQYCSDRGIPIVTHCNESGFKTVHDYHVLAHPNKWEKVLKCYPELKLNLAHMGLANKKSWNDKVIQLVNENKYVYTDFADHGQDKGTYKHLLSKLELNPKLQDKLMFGSDFMINLLTSESYNQYLKEFFDCQDMKQYQNKLSNENPSRFLFGEKEKVEA